MQAKENEYKFSKFSLVIKNQKNKLRSVFYIYYNILCEDDIVSLLVKQVEMLQNQESIQ